MLFASSFMSFLNIMFNIVPKVRNLYVNYTNLNMVAYSTFQTCGHWI